MYNYERCWTDATKTWEIFDQLKSESARLKAVKEQIMIFSK
jgi:hypothetical protein